MQHLHGISQAFARGKLITIVKMGSENIDKLKGVVRM
jgi:hypothetical protein